MKIYLSGRVTGENLEKARSKFKTYQTKLENKGYEVINPLEVNEFHPDKTWLEYMLESIMNLSKCDGIYKIRTNKNSIGSNIESLFALKLNLKFLN